MKEMVGRVVAAWITEEMRWSTRLGELAWEILRRDDGGNLVVVCAMESQIDAARARAAGLRDEACGKAAIAAMREPTEAMLDAAFRCYLDSDTWRAMIDAALKE